MDRGKRVISKIYRALIERIRPDIPPYIAKWENELGISLKKEIRQILLRVYATTVNSNMIETNYKCLVRWHITPDKAHKILKEKSQYCWRGCKEIGTTAHIWWQCPEIKKYWDEIRQIIGEITNTMLPDDPWSCLFHGINMSNKQYLKSLLPPLLNAAKSLIPRHWKEPIRPTMRNWCNKVNEIQNLGVLKV